MAFFFDKEDDNPFFPFMNDEDNVFHLDLGLVNGYVDNMDIFNINSPNPLCENNNEFNISPFDKQKEDFVNDDNISEINNNNNYNGQKNISKIDILFQKTMVETNKNVSNDSFLQKKRNLKNEEEESHINEETPKANIDKIFFIYKEGKKKARKGRNKKFHFGGKHTKFSTDNMIRKIKVYLFSVLLRFINESIKQESQTLEQNSKKKDYSKIFLVKLDQEVIKNINVNINLQLLDSKLKNIFSKKVSKKVESFGLNKNKNLIKEIFDQKKLVKTIQILNMTLYQCLEHFRGTQYYKELAGLEKEFNYVINELKNKGENEKYISEFIHLINIFKEFYEQKTPRRPRKK